MQPEMTSRLEPDELETLTSGSAVGGWGNTLTGRLEGAPCPYHNKTTIALAVAEYITRAKQRAGSQKSAYPVLVVGPGIVTGDQNWPKETREVVPGAQAKVIETAARPVPKPAKIGKWLESQGVFVDYEDRFEGMSARQAYREIVKLANTQGRWREKEGFDRQVRQALWQSLRRGANHPPRCRAKAEKPNLLDARIGGYRWLGLGALARDEAHEAEMRRRYSLAQFVSEYRSGQLPAKSVAVMSYETAKLSPGRVPAMTSKLYRITWKEGGVVQTKIIRACTCPTCGGIVSEGYDDDGEALGGEIVTVERAERFIGAKRRYCQAPVEKRIWNPETGLHEITSQDRYGNRLVCGTPLFECTELRREAAARFVQRKARGFFPYLIFDEVHDARAKGTGNGWALSVLTGSSQYAIGLTGTLFGGYCAS